MTAVEPSLVAIGSVTEKKVDQSGPADAEYFTYIDISSIDNQAKLITDSKRLPLSAAPSRARQRVKAGDVIVSMTRPNLNAVAVISDELSGAVASTGFDVLRAKEATIPPWLYFAVQSPHFIEAMCRVVQGALYPAVRPKDIRQFQIPLPPVEEQRRIVAEIEKQFTRLDAGVASLKRVRTALKRYRASVLKAAVEGRLVPNEAELARGVNCTYETGEELLRRVLKERRDSSKGKRTYKEPVLANAVDLPVLPRGWTWSSVEQLAAPEPNSITDGPFGSNLKTEHYTASGPRVVRLQNIGDGEFIDEEAHISKEHFDRLRKHRVDAGDLVIAALGSTPPRSCLIPTSLGPAIVKADCIRFKVNNKILADYINFALNSDPVRNRTKRIVHGVGRPRLNLAEIKAIVLPLPPRKEQERIVVELERRLSIVQRVSQIVEQSHSRAGRLKQAILDQTFARGTPANVAPDDNVHSQSSAPAVAKEQVQHQPTMTRRARRRIKPTRSLLEILKANPAGITPEELFRASGYLNNGDPDSFYRELAMIAHLLEEQKPSGSDSAAWPGESRVLLKLKVAAA